MVPYSMTNTSLSVVLGFVPKIIPSSHPNFEKIRELLFKPETTDADIEVLLDVKKAVDTFKSENVKVFGGKVYYKGFNITGPLSDQILGFINRGQLDAAEPYKNFLERAQLNPDPRAKTDLYQWVAASGIPITSDGCILAFKAVQNDYLSIHSGPRGKLDHSIGKTVSEPREETNPDPSQTCSRGLHFCSAEYLKQYSAGGTRILALKIDPANVVAFPKDYGNQKGRACEYTVVGEIEDRAKVEEFYPQGRAVYKAYDEVVVQPQALQGYVIGASYRMRNDEVVQVVRIDPDKDYPVRTNDGGAYNLNGRYISDTDESPFDLLGRVY